MAYSIICIICLRTDIKPVKIPKTHSDFFDDFTCKGLPERYTKKRYKFCTVCAHLLKKAYNFKLRCIRSCQLLKSVKIAKNKPFPSDLHSQNPTSLGFCSSLAPYKLLEHKYVEGTDLLDTKDNISLIDPIAPSVCNEVESANVSDPTLHDHMYIKSELDAGEPDGETVHTSQNLTIATTSKGNLILNNHNFKYYIKNVNLIQDESDKTEACVTENDKPSKINDFLRSFGEEITNSDEDNDLNDVIAEVGPNDPFKDEESLNSMDDITSDNDIGSLSMEDMKSDDDSDAADSKLEDSDSDKELDEFLEKLKTTNIKPIKISELQDLELAEALLKIDKRDKSLKTQVLHLRTKTKVLNEITGMFVEGRYDLGDGLVMNKEDFHKMVESWIRSGRVLPATAFVNGVLNKQKAKEFLSQLMKRYNPDYGTIFNIEYMDTAEEKQQEFDRRKDSEAYKNAPHKCTLCYKAFPSAPILEKHNKRHDPIEGGVACQICSLWFINTAKRCSHKWDAHSALYSCKLCPLTLYCFQSMHLHYLQHKGTQYKCPDCHGVFNNNNTLRNHRRKHWTRHACVSCGQAHASEAVLQVHRAREHKDLAPVDPANTVTCPECGIVCDSQAVYNKHAKISHRTRRFRCWCREAFETAAELRGHRRDSGHERPDHKRWRPEPGAPAASGSPGARAPRRGPRPKFATCPICDVKVAHMVSRSLDRHYQEVHPGEPLPYEPKEPYRNLCDECGKAYLTPALLQDHKNTHSGARPYACPTKGCGRRFSSLAAVREHAERHTPRFDCPHCGKLFRSAANRSSHIRTHIQDRRYKCGACGKGFIHAGSLSEHIRHVHNKVRRLRKKKKKQEEEM